MIWVYIAKFSGKPDVVMSPESTPYIAVWVKSKKATFSNCQTINLAYFRQNWIWFFSVGVFNGVIRYPRHNGMARKHPRHRVMGGILDGRHLLKPSRPNNKLMSFSTELKQFHYVCVYKNLCHNICLLALVRIMYICVQIHAHNHYVHLQWKGLFHFNRGYHTPVVINR